MPSRTFRLLPYCLSQNLKHFPLTSQTHSFHQKWCNGLNGDRLDDLLIGVSGAPKRKLDFGAGSLVFFLTRKDSPRISSSGIFQPTRLDASESLGKSVVLGDINGDGQKDILIGAPGILQSKRSGSSGDAYVIFGPKTSS